MMDADQKHYRIYLCGGPHCSTRGQHALRAQLELELWDRELDTRVEVRVGGCQDQCDYGPNLIIWPGPYRYAGLTGAALANIVDQHLQRGEPVLHLLARPDMRR